MKLHSEPLSFAFDRMWCEGGMAAKSSQSCGRSTSCQSKSYKALFVEILCEERKDLYEASNSKFKMASEMSYCLFAS